MRSTWKDGARRWSLRAAKGLGILALLLGCLHLVENWRGRRAWKAHQAQQQARGVGYDLAALAPPPVPDHENVARHPFMAARMVPWATPAVRRTDLPKAILDLQPWKAWQSGRTVDLEALRALGLDSVLAQAEGELAALAEALARPKCRMLDRYDDPDQVPAVLGLRQLGRLQVLRAVVALREGQGEAALGDLLGLLTLCRHLQGEPHLISQLLALALEGIAMQPLWEGLQARAWSDPQLGRLEAALGALAPLEGLRRGLHFERVVSARQLAAHPGETLRFALFVDGRMGWWTSLLVQVAFPRGWGYQNAVHLDQGWLEGSLSTMEGGVYWPERAQQTDERMVDMVRRARFDPTRYLAVVAMPAMLGQTGRAAERASFLAQARLACALERHRRVHGTYPERLEALVPAFLPSLVRDSVEGRPFVYARTATGFRLHSWGTDGRDDGGQMKPLDSTRVGPDWAWAR